MQKNLVINSKQKHNKRPSCLEKKTRIESLFAHIGCPPQLLKVVKQQTGLSEGYIHKKYIEFKQKFPSGFVRKYQLTHLLVDRYITAIGAKNGTEMLDLRQL